MAAATGVVSARDLLAAASERSSAIDYKSDDLTYDMGLMAAFDAHPVDPAQFAEDPEATLLEVARDNAQLLVKKIFELPVSMTEVGPVADLPDRQMRLPRWKPVPKGKTLTRWDKFALSKGIEKKKRGRMIWDEAEQEWKPRYGFKRGKDDTHDWAIPVKAGDDPYADPFEQRDLKKKERVIKNKLAHVKNVERATKASNRKKFGDSDAAAAAPAVSIEGAAAAAGGKGRKSKALKSGSGALVAPRVRLSATAGVGSIPSGIPARLGSNSGLGRDAGAVAASAGGHKAKRRRLTEEGGAAAGGGRAGSGMGVREGKGVKHDRLKSAQVGTASMGRFDAAVKGEPAKRKDPRRLKRLPNEVSAVHESKRSSDILRKVLGGSGEGESSRAGGVPTARGAAPKGGRHEAARASQPPITGMKRKRPGK